LKHFYLFYLSFRRRSVILGLLRTKCEEYLRVSEMKKRKMRKKNTARNFTVCICHVAWTIVKVRELRIRLSSEVTYTINVHKALVGKLPSI
jgi:hypothetical protein